LTLLKILGRNVPLIQKARIYFKFMIASAEELPFDDGGFDTVVVTYSFALSLMQKALEEMRRVLKPTGLLLFCEHGIAPEKEFKRFRDKSHLESCRRMQFK
jgi:ubiquinone/menaquinone biosynthesis C-methylase UbiE